MFKQVTHRPEAEPPSTEARRFVGQAGQYLLYVLCATPIALFPLGLAYRLIFP
jgi:hypothetical protein